MLSNLRRWGLPHCFWTLFYSRGQAWTGAPSLSLAPVLQTWAARAGVPSPCHAIHGAAVVNTAKGYQIWRRGSTARPLLTHAPRTINCSGIALLDPPPGLRTRVPEPGGDLVSGWMDGWIRDEFNLTSELLTAWLTVTLSWQVHDCRFSFNFKCHWPKTTCLLTLLCSKRSEQNKLTIISCARLDACLCMFRNQCFRSAEPNKWRIWLIKQTVTWFSPMRGPILSFTATPCATTTRQPPWCATTAPAWWRLGSPAMTHPALCSPPSSAAPVTR